MRNRALLHHAGGNDAFFDYKNGNTILFFGETKVVFYDTELTEEHFDTAGVVATFDDTLV